jgi:ATP-binding cassette subfamily F protein 3
MLSEANFLILDEPTNHLDITSKEILENALNNYTGTVLYVSHDRYFINKTATRILDLTQQNLLNYIGNYDYYLEKKPEIERLYLSNNTSSQGQPVNESTSNQTIFVPGFGNINGIKNQNIKSQDFNNLNDCENQGTDGNGKVDWKQQKEEQAKLRKRQSDLKKTEDEISSLESRNDEIDLLLAKEEIYTNVSKLLELNDEKKSIQKRLEELLEMWEELAD